MDWWSIMIPFYAEGNGGDGDNTSCRARSVLHAPVLPFASRVCHWCIELSNRWNWWNDIVLLRRHARRLLQSLGEMIGHIPSVDVFDDWLEKRNSPTATARIIHLKCKFGPRIRIKYLLRLLSQALSSRYTAHAKFGEVDGCRALLRNCGRTTSHTRS
jgi:hypothetical protein